MLALFYLQVDKDKIFISFILSLLAYFMLVIYFIYQVKLETEFKKLFKEYILLPKTPEKSKVIDVAVGELNLKTSGKLKVNGKEFPLSEFIELFDKQFDLRRK